MVWEHRQLQGKWNHISFHYNKENFLSIKNSMKRAHPIKRLNCKFLIVTHTALYGTQSSIWTDPGREAGTATGKLPALLRVIVPPGKWPNPVDSYVCRCNGQRGRPAVTFAAAWVGASAFWRVPLCVQRSSYFREPSMGIPLPPPPHVPHFRVRIVPKKKPEFHANVWWRT